MQPCFSAPKEVAVEIYRLVVALVAISLVLAGSVTAQDVVSLSVGAHMDIYRAGGYNDGSNGAPPPVYTFPAGPNQAITFSSIAGTWTCQYNLPFYGPDGTTAPGNCLTGGHQIENPIGPFSGYAATDFAGALAGVFLEDSLPTAAPPPLRFYISNNSQGGIQTNFARLNPQIGQVFFIGDGLTGTGTGEVQVFAVPSSATHLYLGYIDSCNDTVPGCFSDNSGTLTVTIAARITGLCNTGQTAATAAGCTGVLVPPNPTGGGDHQDGNWELAYPYPSTLSTGHGACDLKTFVRAWVDTPNPAWLPNSAGVASEWITPVDGENNLSPGWYVYRTAFPVPDMLPGGSAPTGFTINGRLASDNATYAILLESPANSGICYQVTGLREPINPGLNFQHWWNFTFTNPIAITPGADANLYFVVQNLYDTSSPNGFSPTGLRVEFAASSTFH